MTAVCPREVGVTAFQLFIDDDRYAVPTLRILAVRNAARARALARQAMADCPHHLGVELYDEEQRVLALGTLRTPRAEAPRRLSDPAARD